jgi:hypothetical protein
LADSTGKKPESEHPHEDDFPLDLGHEHADSPAGEHDFLPEGSLSGSIEDFQFTGPAEELDFSEPADFTFPAPPADEHEAAGEHAGEFASAAEFAGTEHAEGERTFGGDEHGFGEPPSHDESAFEPAAVEEAIPDLESAEEEVKPKRQLPAWVRTAEWITISLLATGSLLAVIVSIFLIDKNPSQVTLILNIGCPVMLGLIPYALWRSSGRWVVPAGSAVYTLMLAIGTMALITGTWFLGMEVSRYDWQFNKARVTAAKPHPPLITPTPRAALPEIAKPVEQPAADSGAAKGTAAPVAPGK